MTGLRAAATGPCNYECAALGNGPQQSYTCNSESTPRCAMPTEHLPSEGESAESRTWRLGVQRPRAAPVALFCFLIALVGPVLFICLPLDDPNSIRDGAGLELDRVSGWVMRLAGSAFFLIIGGVLGTTASRAGLRTETITIDPECFIIEHSLFGRTRHQRYVRRLIGDLRVPDDVPGVADREGFNPAGGGALAFQHGGQTISSDRRRTAPRRCALWIRFSTLHPTWQSPRPFSLTRQLSRMEFRHNCTQTRRREAASCSNASPDCFASSFRRGQAHSRGCS